jgi:plasmid stabilization system protein ParE
VQISFHPAATDELEASVDWYAERSPSSAREFCVAFDLALQKIESEPERFALVDDRHRACSVERFPFQIVFLNENDRIHVVAVVRKRL